MDPDVQVENDPKAVIQGRDPQLERGGVSEGAAEVLKRIKADPKRLPQRPDDPVKTR